MTLRLRRTAAAAAVGLVVLAGAGCTPPPGHDAPGSSPTSATATQAPVPIVGGERPGEQLLALVLERHLQNRGIPAVVAGPSAEPWEAAGGPGIAVVDSLAMAAEVAPGTLAGPVPTPSPSPAASGSGAAATAPGASAVATPSDPAPASPTGHPTATGTPTPLPDGRPAADAQGTTAMVSEHFPDGVEVVGSSPGTMRVQAVTTTALSGLYDLEELTDLNGLCDRFGFTPAEAAGLYAERLEVLAGCAPADWVEAGGQGPAVDLVAGRADVALVYGTDPAIPDHALEPLADPGRILPEGRVLLLADPDGLPDGVAGAVNEVAQRLDGEMLAELQRLSSGPDALPGEEAAQYWLVAAGLEQKPEDWF
jgi:hypothetical protein